MSAGNQMTWRATIWACAVLALACGTAAADPSPAAQLVAHARAESLDAPRVELAARLTTAGFGATPEFQAMREDAARELAGRPDGIGAVSAAELAAADPAIARQIARSRGGRPGS